MELVVWWERQKPKKLNVKQNRYRKGQGVARGLLFWIGGTRKFFLFRRHLSSDLKAMRSEP